LTTHVRSSWEKWQRARRIDGSATLTIDASITNDELRHRQQGKGEVLGAV